jgi:hypothetical protein
LAIKAVKVLVSPKGSMSSIWVFATSTKATETPCSGSSRLALTAPIPSVAAVEPQAVVDGRGGDPDVVHRPITWAPGGRWG